MKIRTLIPFDRLKGNTHIPAALPQHLELIEHLIKKIDLHPDVSDKLIRCVINAIWLAGYNQGQRTPVFSIEKYTDEEAYMENNKKEMKNLEIARSELHRLKGEIGGWEKLGRKAAVHFIRTGNYSGRLNSEKPKFIPNIQKNEAERLVREIFPESRQGGPREGSGRKPGKKNEAVRLVREVSPEPKRGDRREGSGRKPGLNSQRREAMKSKRS